MMTAEHDQLSFLSDNAAPVALAVLDALHAANEVDLSYGDDKLSGRLDDAFSNLFGGECSVLWVTTGTAANCLALSTLVPPHGAVLCHHRAHINVDEGGAPEFFTHGAKLISLDGEGAKLAPEAIRDARRLLKSSIHQVQPHAVSISNATECGLVYTPDEVGALSDAARGANLALHMDGARFANAVAHLGCHPGDLSWRAGVDVLSFGFIKNGGLSAEALVFFRKDLIEVAKLRRKRSGHLSSKGRYQAAQLLAMLEQDLWLLNARAANAAASAIADAAATRLAFPVQANEIFLRLTADESARLRAQGFEFYDWGIDRARFVTSWHHRPAGYRRLADAIQAL